MRGVTSSQECASGKVLIEELGDSQFFVAGSPAMRNIYRQFRLLADSGIVVVILGECGIGNEVIANLIHENSQRSRHRFLKLNCAAIPCDLLESESSGHLRGAFTGAIRDRAGKFEQAHRGTQMLDEIGEVPEHTLSRSALQDLAAPDHTPAAQRDPSVRADCSRRAKLGNNSRWTDRHSVKDPHAWHAGPSHSATPALICRESIRSVP